MKTGAVEKTPLFEGKRILVTGGTGSLGKTLIRRLITGVHGRPAAVIVLSRDEAKQYDMRLAFMKLRAATEEVIYRDYADVLQFRIGDVRDPASVASALQNVDIVFNAAALKQVPSCEYFPTEAVSTNVLGPENIVRCIDQLRLPVETVIGISTDKACKPINVMGMTKALQERVFINANLRCRDTRFVCVRYGNVLASRGSVVPLFHDQISSGGPVTITTREMTRFLLSLNQAVDTIIDAYRIAERGEILVPRVPASSIVQLANCLIGTRKIELREVGVRPGEKIHEILVSEDEVYRTVIRGNYYVVRSLLPELSSNVRTEDAIHEEFSSRTHLMSAAETLLMLEREKLRIEDKPNFRELFG
ncbi:MAG: polysaccharide biosynthesis protein [Planctomycetota bacterium]